MLPFYLRYPTKTYTRYCYPHHPMWENKSSNLPLHWILSCVFACASSYETHQFLHHSPTIISITLTYFFFSFLLNIKEYIPSISFPKHFLIIDLVRPVIIILLRHLLWKTLTFSMSLWLSSTQIHTSFTTLAANRAWS